MTQEQLDRLAMVNDSLAICCKEVLTIDEAAQYTGLKKSYLYKLTAAKAIPHYKPNGKNCFFRRKELENWLTSIPVATASDINSDAVVYCMRNKLPFKK